MSRKKNKASLKAQENPTPLNVELIEARKALQTAENLRIEKMFDKAISICAKLLNKFPNYFGAIFTMGLIYADKKDFYNGLIYLNRAQMMNPSNKSTLIALSGVYSALNSNEMAARTLSEVLKKESEDVNALVSLAYIYNQEREYELAYETYKEAMNLEPEFDAANLGFGLAAKQIGRHTEAADALWRVVKRGTFGIEPIYALVTTRGVKLNDQILEYVSRVKPRFGQDQNIFEANAEYIKAEILYNSGDYEGAWLAASKANKIFFERNKAEVEIQNNKQKKSMDYISKFNEKITFQPVEKSELVPLFILGASRSGKSTLEAALVNLKNLKRGFENPSADIAVRRTFQEAGFPSSHLYSLLPAALNELCRKHFVEELRPRTRAASIFTNTDPSRIHDALKISAIMPNSRFIFVRRRTEDLVPRIYMRSYAAGNYYSYRVEDVISHIYWYNSMIDILDNKLGKLSIVIDYENFIENPVDSINLIAKFLGTEVDDEIMLDFQSDIGFGHPFRKFWA